MNNYLILRSENSPYNDVTKSSVLSFADMDNNLLFLKGNIIYTAITNGGTVTLKKYNGEDITFAGGGGSGSGDSYWTSGSTGNYSIKTINDTTTDATGNYAVAEGADTLASGYGSHAEGIYTQAIGNGSHSEGGYFDGFDYISGGTAISHGSHAEGRLTIAGWKSFMVDSVANGLIRINASYGDMTAEFIGYRVILDTNIYTYNTVTFSSTTNTEILLNDLSVNTGSNVAAIENLNSPYGDTFDNGVNSHAEGSQTKSLGYYSHAEGQATIASGNYGSHAEGVATIASGNDGSHAEGRQTIASNVSSHAEGIYTIANGPYSHAEGNSTITNSDASHAEGVYTIAGWMGFTIDSVVNGVITLSSSYGDMTNEFVNNQVILDTNIYTYNTVTFSSATNTEILLDDTTVNGGYIVADIGYLNSQYADNVMGEYSHAEGYSTIALGYGSHAEGGFSITSGVYSHAEGSGTIAGGNNSHAEGEDTKAIGDASHAEGYKTKAIGANSHAEGMNTTAIAINSHTEGSGTTASGDASHAEGQGSTAIGYASHAEGYNTKAIGEYSHAEGNYTIAGWKGFNSFVVNGVITIDLMFGDVTSEFTGFTVILDTNIYTYNTVTFSSGTNTEIFLDDTSINGGVYVADYQNLNSEYTTNFLGNNSHVEGAYNGALGQRSHAEGSGTIASGYASHAQNRSTFSSGDYSHAEGDTTIASGETSHAEGRLTNALGNYSHSQGIQTTALGVASHAEGDSTNSNGQASHSEGRQTIADADYSHAEGWVTTASGVNGSHAEGFNTIASGASSHAEGSYTTAGGQSSHAGSYNSKATGDWSFIHSYNSLVTGVRSVVLGGQSITGATDDTVYVPYLNVQSASTDNALTQVLVIDTSGNVKKRDVSTISGGGSTSPISVVNTSSLFSTGLSNTGLNASGVTNSIFMGQGAGYVASGANNSNLIGYQAGYGATGSTSVNFIGANAGNGATNATSSIFIGTSAGISATNAYGSVFIGAGAGQGAFYSNDSNFLGQGAGQSATNANNSNFLGQNAGSGATNASYSNLFGYQAGKTFASNNIGTNNIIIGTNISLPNSTANAINIGGVLFGTGTYSSITGSPAISANTSGKIGIGIVTPTEKLHVSGNLLVDGNLTFTGQTNNPVYTAGTVTATHIPNWNNSNIQHVILSAATTSISGGTNIANGAVYTIILKQNASGSRVVNWGTQYKWQSGIAPVLSSIANAVDIITLISDGTNLYGLIAKDFR